MYSDVVMELDKEPFEEVNDVTANHHHVAARSNVVSSASKHDSFFCIFVAFGPQAVPLWSPPTGINGVAFFSVAGCGDVCLVCTYGALFAGGGRGVHAGVLRARPKGRSHGCWLLVLVTNDDDAHR